VIAHFFNEKGKINFSFKGEIKTAYMPGNIVGELDDYADGKVKPKGTLLEIMKVIDGFNRKYSIVIPKLERRQQL
jgi:hypothetical protein